MSKSKLQIGNLSDVGRKRTVNEDYYGSFSGKFGNLIIVCDGMGGHKGGATASRLAVETIKLHFEQLNEKFNPKEELKKALDKSNENILQKAAESEELKEMGSTAVVLLIKDNFAYYAHIGDSRIYLIRKNKIYQLTKDHSLVQQLIDSGIIDEEAAKNHPQKNVITRSLGAEGKNQPEIAEPISIFKNDIFILCTDGLTAYLSDEELQKIASENDVQNACKTMIDLANERGGKDNITVQIIKVVKGKNPPINFQKLAKKLFIPLVSALGLILIVASSLFIDIPSLFKSSTSKEIKDTTKVKIVDSLGIVDTSKNKITRDSISIEISSNDSINKVMQKLNTTKKKQNNK